MKAAGRPFKATHYGQCPINGVHPIKKGDLIVKIEKPVSWIKEHRARGGRFYNTKRSTQHVHVKCLEEKEK